MQKLIKAVLAVMKEVENIDKNMNVGTGRNSYSGVSDKDVKLAFNKAMVKNNLIMLPIQVEGETNVTRWEESTDYGIKQKQSVLTTVHTRYLLAHESGESVELAGYGHGIDSQDKGAGKATTYAMKYALLYSFITPTGNIDDADKTHSDNIEVPKQKKPTVAKKKPVADKPKEKTKKEQDEYNLRLKQAIIQAGNSNGIKELTDVWKYYKELHAEDMFIDAVKDKRKELEPEKVGK